MMSSTHAQDIPCAPTIPSAPTVPPSSYQEILTNTTKGIDEFRTYTQDEDTPDRVVEHYRDMRAYQTVEFYDRMEKKYSFESQYCIVLLMNVSSSARYSLMSRFSCRHYYFRSIVQMEHIESS